MSDENKLDVGSIQESPQSVLDGIKDSQLKAKVQEILNKDPAAIIRLQSIKNQIEQFTNNMIESEILPKLFETISNNEKFLEEIAEEMYPETFEGSLSNPDVYNGIQRAAKKFEDMLKK